MPGSGRMVPDYLIFTTLLPRANAVEKFQNVQHYGISALVFIGHGTLFNDGWHCLDAMIAHIHELFLKVLWPGVSGVRVTFFGIFRA